MSEKKQPEVGEWWKDLNDDVIVSVKAAARQHSVCFDRNDGKLCLWSIDTFLLDFEHLPDCTGWDWQPEVFPQWRESKNGHIAFVRIESDSFTPVKIDGTECARASRNEYPSSWQGIFNRPRLTREQAEALVQKPAPVEPVESPDDWVTQDRVPPRHSIDQVQWSNWHRSKWVDAVGKWEGEQHGFIDKDDESTLRVRCRRKDLPPMPEPEKPKTRKVKLKEFAYWNQHLGSWSLCWFTEFTMSVRCGDHFETGNTREIEVPL